MIAYTDNYVKVDLSQSGNMSGSVEILVTSGEVKMKFRPGEPLEEIGTLTSIKPSSITIELSDGRAIKARKAIIQQILIRILPEYNADEGTIEFFKVEVEEVKPDIIKEDK